MGKNFIRKVLDNGMTIFLEKRDLPVVSVAFAVRAGGVNEKIKEKGIFHFIEHMLYKGTKKRNSFEIARAIESKGGILNGFTSEEMTAFWCKLPSKYFKIALDVLGDMIKNPSFKEEELEKERKVIFEEIKMYHDNPQLYALDKIQNLLYTGTMGKDLIGSYETVGSLDRKKLLEKFKEIYTPNNLIIGVVGDAEFSEIEEFAKKNFGGEKNKVPEEEFELKNSSLIEEREGLTQANLVFAYHVPLLGNEKSYAAVILNEILAGGMSSRLFREIREKRNLAYSIKGDSNLNKKFSYNLVYVGTKKENIEKVKIIILDELKKISESFSEAELLRIKNQIIGRYYLSMEDSQEQLVNLLSYEINKNAEDFYNFKNKILKIKLEDIKKLAKIKKYSFFALIPK